MPIYEQPKAIMLCGLPGSGKTTFTETFDIQLYDYISSDLYINIYASGQGKTYNEVFKEHIKEAEKKMWSDFNMCISDESWMIIDRTNLTKKSRAKFLRPLKEAEYDVTCMYLYTDPLSVTYERNKEREGKTIPTQVLNSMSDNTEIPSLEEGFNRIYKIIT